MPPRCPSLQGTLTPFLYPSLLSTTPKAFRPLLSCIRRRHESTTPHHDQTPLEGSHLNPPPTDYARTLFTDHALITLHAGAGGHGCVSFLREKFIEAGPPNGGDGGTGGNIYIQATRDLTSLHKLSRRNILRAGHGRNGQGKTRGGERGEDVVIQVPVGTVVREIERYDPAAEEEVQRQLEAGSENGNDEDTPYRWDRERWLLYPAITPEDVKHAEFPRLPKGRKSALAMSQVAAPITLDLSQPMEQPLLLSAGAVGGLGNPHFVTKTVPRPKYASKGSPGMKIVLELELKLLADVGLVGLPNAGKSTLLRAMSKARARVGNWAFTTLQPNIGTVVLDDFKGRAGYQATFADGEPRTNFTIADIPGLVADAHLDRGLGISFLRHVERARVLAFVVDLNAGDAVAQLKGLWKEVSLYEDMKIQEAREEADPMVEWSPFTSPDDARSRGSPETIVMPSSGPTFENPLNPEAISIKGKPWFVVATKADLPGTQENFQTLKAYLERMNGGEQDHPCFHEGMPEGKEKDLWEGEAVAIPVSAINGHGTEKIREWVVGLLDD